MTLWTGLLNESMSAVPGDRYEMPEEPALPQAALRTSGPSQHPKDDPGTSEPFHRTPPPENEYSGIIKYV